MIGHIVIIVLLAGISVVMMRVSRTIEDLSHDLRRKTDVKVDIRKDNE